MANKLARRGALLHVQFSSNENQADWESARWTGQTARANEPGTSWVKEISPQHFDDKVAAPGPSQGVD